MKITEIKTYPVFVGTRNQCIVKVETDAGWYGWGEAGLSGRHGFLLPREARRGASENVVGGVGRS